MQVRHASDFRCPHDGNSLRVDSIEIGEKGEIKEGTLRCNGVGHIFAIKDSLPRFCESGYSENFGEQWNRFRRTQLDKFNGTTLSKDRFYSGTGWTTEELKGARVLEVGCGAGRFTQVMLDAGAIVYSMDLSTAVDACYANNGFHPDLCIVQADVYHIPFAPQSFDFVFCYGVLQHTPDPRASFTSLVKFVKPGGRLAIDIYHKGFSLEPYKSKYLYRPVTTRMPRGLLFKVIKSYVPKWLPVDTIIKRNPVLRRTLGVLIPCWNYWYLPLTPQQRVEWGILDTFDALAPHYDYPQTEETVRRWFHEEGLVSIDVRLGGNGVLGNGRTPAHLLHQS